MNRKYDIVFFDFDGTLAVNESKVSIWTHIRERYGLSLATEEDRHNRYRQGLISLDDWIVEELGEWKERGITREDIEREVRDSLRLHLHVPAVLRRLKEEGCRLILVSGGLRVAFETVFPDHPFDEVFIGDIEFDQDGRIIGNVKNPHGHEEGKRDVVMMIAEREGVPLSRTVFVGDGFNDLHAIQTAGFSIAFNSDDETIRQAASIVIDSGDYRDILPHLLHKV